MGNNLGKAKDIAGSLIAGRILKGLASGYMATQGVGAPTEILERSIFGISV